MNQTSLLASALGPFFVILGAALLLRRRYFMPIVEDYARSGVARLNWAAIELPAGLFLVVTHNEWSSVPAILVTLIGWWAVLEACALLLLPDAFVQGVLRALNKPAWYVAGGIAQVIAGLYLAAFGFGWT